MLDPKIRANCRAPPTFWRPPPPVAPVFLIVPIVPRIADPELSSKPFVSFEDPPLFATLAVGMGHQSHFQIKNWNSSFSHGGSLRKNRKGRGARPFTPGDPLHIVFKVNRQRIRTRSLRTFQNFQKITWIVSKYSQHFFIKVEQLSIQGDHIHALIRTRRRSQFHHFFRVVAGQIAQQFEHEGKLVTHTPRTRRVRGVGLWRFRPFSRVVKGWRAYHIVRNYIQLNEKEALGEIPYRKERLRGLSLRDWEILWS